MSQTPLIAYGEPDVGFHNSNLASSTIRHIQGGSWKKQDTVIVVPAGKTVPTKAAFAWMNLLYPPNQMIQRFPVIGVEVGEAYTAAIDQILAHPQLKDFQYLLTLEHDNIPPPDGLLRLIAQMEAHPEFSCIGGLYWTKGPGGVPQIWGNPYEGGTNFRPQPPDPNGGLVECCGTGMGFNLWRLPMFKDSRLPRPLFKTKASLAEGVGTQDLVAWQELRKLGYRCAVDCSIRVGHFDVNTDMTW